MRVVHGEQRDALPRRQHLVHQHAAIAAIGADMGGVVVDLDAMRGLDRQRILGRERIPAGMGDGDEGARGGAARGKRHTRLVRPGAGEIHGQADGQDVPGLAQ
jgi:hypothetical protein